MPNIELHPPGTEPGPPLIECGRSTIELWNLYIVLVSWPPGRGQILCNYSCARDNLRGQKSLGPLKMSLKMAHKVIVRQKKIMSQSFLNSGTLIVITALAKSIRNVKLSFLRHWETARPCSIKRINFYNIFNITKLKVTFGSGCRR
jgi:hypothetical protein